MRAIPVIVFSTYVQPEIIRKSYTLGANSYIIKPHELRAFLRVIHTLVEYWFTVAVLCDPASLPQERQDAGARGG